VSEIDYKMLAKIVVEEIVKGNNGEDFGNKRVELKGFLKYLK
jgi:hypothetical protein